MYLNNPLALPVNSNPGWVFPKVEFKDDRERCVYLAKIASGLFRYKQKFESGDLEPDSIKARDGTSQFLCMDQYYRIFNTYRRPGLERDSQEISDGRQPRDREFVVVLRCNRVFVVTVKEPGSGWLSPSGLAKVYLDILNKDLEKLPVEDAVGLLTSSSRDKWAEHRQRLIEAGNEAAIEAFESCLFIVCLDDRAQNATDEERSQKSRFEQMLHGNGKHFNGANRWFDKTIQVVCSADGVSGICYEHSVAEGIAVVAVLTDVLQSKDEVHIDEDFEKANEAEIRQIDFKINDQIRDSIQEALEAFKNLVDDTDVEVFRFVEFGKDLMKSCKCSPDAFVQMALQLAYYR